MEAIQSTILWVKTHWVEIVSIYTSIVGLASIIVKLTPNLKDDNILLAIIKFLGKYIALNRSGDASARANIK